jgi:hypothetical protein
MTSSARSSSIDGSSTLGGTGLLGGKGDGSRGPINRRSVEARDGELASLVGDSGRGVVERVLLEALDDGRIGNGGSSIVKPRNQQMRKLSEPEDMTNLHK